MRYGLDGLSDSRLLAVLRGAAIGRALPGFFPRRGPASKRQLLAKLRAAARLARRRGLDVQEALVMEDQVKRCITEGCTLPARLNGLCIRCYREKSQAERTAMASRLAAQGIKVSEGIISEKEITMPESSETCQVPGCQNKPARRGICYNHARLLNRPGAEGDLVRQHVLPDRRGQRGPRRADAIQPVAGTALSKPTARGSGSDYPMLDLAARISEAAGLDWMRFGDLILIDLHTGLFVVDMKGGTEKVRLAPLGP